MSLEWTYIEEKKMICDECNTEGVLKEFSTFSYYYCSPCKKEIELKEETNVLTYDMEGLTFDTMPGAEYDVTITTNSSDSTTYVTYLPDNSGVGYDTTTIYPENPAAKDQPSRDPDDVKVEPGNWFYFGELSFYNNGAVAIYLDLHNQKWGTE